MDSDEKREQTVRRYRQSKKGKRSKARADKKYNQTRKAITGYLTGEDLKLLPVLVKKKGNRTMSEIVLIALRMWALLE